MAPCPGARRITSASHAYRLAKIAGVAAAGAVIAVSAATPFLEHLYYQRWFTFPNVLVAAQVPLVVAVLSLAFWWALLRKKELMPFLLTLALYLLCFIGLGISMRSLPTTRIGDQPVKRIRATNSRTKRRRWPRRRIQPSIAVSYGLTV